MPKSLETLTSARTSRAAPLQLKIKAIPPCIYCYQFERLQLGCHVVHLAPTTFYIRQSSKDSLRSQNILIFMIKRPFHIQLFGIQSCCQLQTKCHFEYSIYFYEPMILKKIPKQWFYLQVWKSSNPYSPPAVKWNTFPQLTRMIPVLSQVTLTTLNQLR